MALQFVLGLAALAILVEAFGPWLMKKFFPQALTAEAPEVPVRPKRSAERHDTLVDDQLAQMSPANPSSPAARAIAGPLVTDAPVHHVDLDPNMDYTEFSQAQRDQEAAVAATAQMMDHQQGVRDIFENEATGVSA